MVRRAQGAAGMVRLREKGKYHACGRYGISIKHSHAPALPHLPTRQSYSISRPNLPEPSSSESQLVWELALREPPSRLEVLCKALLLLHCCNNGGIDSLLVCNLALGEGLLRLGLARSEELLLSRDLALLRVLGKVRVIDLLVDLMRQDMRREHILDSGAGHLEVAEVKLRRCGDRIGLIDPPKRDTVDLVWASDQKQSARELLEEDDALAAEATREEDEDGTGCEGVAELRGSGELAALLGLMDILSRVEPWCLGGGDDTLLAILVTTNLLLLGGSDISGGGLFRLFDALVEAALGEDLGTREAADAVDELLAAGHLCTGRGEVSTSK